MANSHAVHRLQSTLRNQLHHLEKREKRTYQALAALVAYVKGAHRQTWKINDFSQFKKTVLADAHELKLVSGVATKTMGPKFNVKHYERAILCASDSTYRDMAIQAAGKDLSKEAMSELVRALGKNCRATSRRIRDTMAELRNMEQPVIAMRRMWQGTGAVELAVD